MNNCVLCNYQTKNRSNFNKHCTSLQHLNNEEKNIICVLCNKKYITIQTYKQHKKNVHDKSKNTISKSNTKIIIEEVKEEINNINDNINKSNDQVKQEIKEEIQNSKKEVVTVVNKAITKASSLIKYLMENHKSVPPLKKIKKNECINRLRIDYDCPETENEDYSLQKTFIKDYSKNIFIQNIAKSILNLVNYKDKKTQPIYNTDCTRYNYVVKITGEVWNEDKSGIKFTDFIIRPLFRYIRELNEEYIEVLDNINMRKNTYAENEKLIYLKDAAYNLDIALTNDYFIKPILKELSPYLRFLQYELEEMEKLEELVKIQEDLQEIIDNNNDSISNNNNDDINDINDINDEDINDNYIKKIKVRLI